MKQLILIRHAKAQNGDITLPDIERPLHEYGQDDAQQMGKLLREKGLSVDAMISSPANRAITTARLMAEFLSFPKSQIVIDDRIYENTLEYLLTLINELDNKLETVILVGHNPSFSHLACYLLNNNAIEIPTCGVYSLKIDTEWGNVGFDCADLNWHEAPKSS